MSHRNSQHQIMSVRQTTFANHCTSSPSIIDVVIDDERSESHVIYMDDDSNSQTKQASIFTTDDEGVSYRPAKHSKSKTPKSHRVIEKRRRDRMNRSLDVLLDLIPHQKPDSERRIEKVEIIETAIKYLKSLGSTARKPVEPVNLNRKTNLKTEAYRTGYHNAVHDVFEYTNKHIQEEGFLSNLIQFVKQREKDLANLTVVPERQGEISLTNHILQTNFSSSQSNTHQTHSQFSIDDEDDEDHSNQQTKVPIFVLHPSGTHYIPMCVDLSVVSHGLNRSTAANDQTPCHPVSIPVNFSSMSAISDPYELEVQNINVIAARHQTSVRPS